MNKTRTLLISGLATMTLIITLIETGFLNLESQPLIAQEDASGLTLEKDGEQVLIPLDEWVVISIAYDPSNTVRGFYSGMTVDALRIQEKGKSFQMEIPIDKIGSIFRQKPRKEYVRDGIKFGRLVSLGIGVSVSLTFITASGFDLEQLPSIFIIGGIMAVASSIFTVPGGAVLGSIHAQAPEGIAVEYVIGDGEWVIVK
mgnify:CR=1 FL=1